MAKKKHKVIVIGLPKTGTSTLAVMLRMLNYTVTGPYIEYQNGDDTSLDEKFNEFDAFQDFPWCFEWQRFKDVENIKFIILKRNHESWWKSFYESYGNKEESYLSFPYFKLSKIEENKEAFISYYKEHYLRIDSIVSIQPKKFLSIDINTFEWKDLCDFLGEPIPKNVFGLPARKPHAKKKYSQQRKSKIHKIKITLRELFLPIIGRNNWNTIIAFFRKNNFI